MKTVLHLLAALHFAYICYYDWYYVKIPMEDHVQKSFFGTSGKLKFLTYWNAIIQGVFFTICFLNDFLDQKQQSSNTNSKLKTIEHTLLASIAFPLSMFVGVTFWGLYIIDRELVFPKMLDPYFPTWLNHAMHTNIMIFILIEMYTNYHPYPKRTIGIGTLITLMATYLIWVHIIYAYSGIWVYPVLNVLPLLFRIVFFAFALILVIGFYIMGEKFTKTLHYDSEMKTKCRKVK